MSTVKILAASVVALAAVYTAWAGWGGRSLPLGIAGVSAMWVAAGLGFTACAIGGVGAGLEMAGGNWMSPWILAGIVLGVALLASLGAAAARASVGPVATTAQWTLVIGALIAAKLVLTSAQALTALAQKG